MRLNPHEVRLSWEPPIRYPISPIWYPISPIWYPISPTWYPIPLTSHQSGILHCLIFTENRKTTSSTAYVVRREGNVLTCTFFSVCPSIHPSICLSTLIRTWGGVPISHNALQHFPECHGADTRGVPCQVQLWRGGVPCRGVPCWGVPCWGRYPARRVPCWGGTLPGGTLLGGYPGQVPPLGQVRMVGSTLPGGGGGTQEGQQKEYSIHGGRYASCVHAGGLSCCFNCQ